jgi:hypothetical protein
MGVASKYTASQEQPKSHPFAENIPLHSAAASWPFLWVLPGPGFCEWNLAETSLPGPTKRGLVGITAHLMGDRPPRLGQHRAVWVGVLAPRVWFMPCKPHQGIHIRLVLYSTPTEDGRRITELMSWKPVCKTHTRS